jgi:hypothetical protein
MTGLFKFLSSQHVAAAILLCTAVGSSKAQEGPVSLFGISIGSSFKSSKDYLFVQEDRDTLYYSRRTPTNSEYLLQGVAISKLSHAVIQLDGRTGIGSANVCHRMLSETTVQLTARYPKLKERIDDVDGTAWHLLSMDRTGCVFNESVAGMSLQIPCSSSFLLHCERASNAFVIEASDTEYSHLAQNDARSRARSPARNHLD